MYIYVSTEDTWPFHYVVTLMLLDQDGKNHVSQRVTTDPSCPDFCQPTTERNNLVGVDNYAPLTVLASDSPHAKNNVVFFKVCIRKAD